MFVVRNRLKNMIHQLLDTGDTTVGCRCLMYMDVMPCAPPSQNMYVRINEYLVNSWANDGVSA